MTMNEELVQLFKEVAGEKKVFPYNFTNVILDTIPRVKPLWEDFTAGTRKFQMDKLIKRHGVHFQICEIHFIEFLKTGPFTASEIFQIMYIQKYIDSNGMAEKFKYTTEEIDFMLNDGQELTNQDYEVATETYFKEKRGTTHLSV